MAGNNFWAKLKNSAQGGQAIYALAPMAGITDSAFRQICKEFGADVVYSEMASVNALSFSSPKKTLKMLEFTKAERPYVVQLFGKEPEYFAKAVKLLTEKGLSRFKSGLTPLVPDGIDINFGCPVPKVAKQGAGAELMRDLKLSRKIIKTLINSTNLPVSIKIRAKVKEIDALKFLDNLSDLDIKAVMIHGRSLAQVHAGNIDFEIIKKARGYFNGIILANGGVMSADDARALLDKTKADGVGIARGALGKPWIFKAVRTGQNVERSQRAVFKIALKHAEKLKGRQGIIEMRKHLCWYAHGLPGARNLRERFVKIESLKDIKNIIKECC